MNAFVFIVLAPVFCAAETDGKVPGSFILRWRVDDGVTSCEDTVTNRNYSLCFTGSLLELNGELYGKKFGRSSLFCNPADVAYIGQDGGDADDPAYFVTLNYICTQYFATYHGTFVMDLSFQVNCELKPFIAPAPQLLSLDPVAAEAGTVWTVIRSKLLPYGTKSFDGISGGKIEFCSGMVLSDDWNIKHDVFYGILLNGEDYGAETCQGFCGMKSDYGCFCDEECSFRGDCCHDVCASCYIACDPAEPPDCTNQNICSEDIILPGGGTCEPSGHRQFTVGDTCNSAETCGIHCKRGELGSGLFAIAGFIECTPNGLKITGASACCFAASSAVTIMSGERPQQIRIDELKIGDKVASVDESGRLVYQEIYYESHAFPSLHSEEITKFNRIMYGDEFVDITDDHMIYLSSSRLNSPNDHCIMYGSEKVCVYPSEMVSVGDTLWIVDVNNNDRLAPRNVTAISAVYDKPRSPRIMNGNILVNNVLCSNHPTHHNSNQAIYSLFRVIYQICPSLMESETFALLWKSAPLVKVRFFIRDLAAENHQFAECSQLAIYSSYLVFGVFVLRALKKSCKLVV